MSTENSVSDAVVQPAAAEAEVGELAPLENNKTVSFSLDQVNDNADELIALRGEGRYFGVTDVDPGPICSNCHRRGHMRNKCKVVVCHACGAVDDHYETQCPKSMVCTNCGQKGHFKGQCQEKIRRTFCRLCESRNHSDDRCPSIWRSYLTKPNRVTTQRLPRMYCYNCGRENHYGDECNQYRGSKTPNIDGSGFSGNNLPRELREIYYQRKNNTKKRGSGDRDEDFSADYYDGDTLGSKRQRPNEYTSRSGYLNSNGNENKARNKKNSKTRKRESEPANTLQLTFTASKSGKLPSGNNKYDRNSGHKRGFLPFKNSNENGKRSYHKRF